MRLKKIFLRGFKSFADPVWLEFPYNFSVIIGPNGSGKSNIVDAIKWVLGERRTSQFRTSSLKDVLFKGSSSRGPASVAEVSVSLENTDRSFPIESDEVILTRRISRDGLSTFLVNGAEVRMKDVHALLWDTGLFKGGYTIIEQDQITRLTVQDPQELRTLVEEAAGITRFKLRQKETITKLKELETALQPLKEKLSLMEAELQSLQEEVEKEERYRELDRKIREGYFKSKSYDYFKHRENIEKLQNKILKIKEEAGTIESEIEKLSRDLLFLQGEMEKTTLSIEEILRRLEEEKVQEARRKERITHLRERIANNISKIENLNRELDEIEKKINSEENKKKAIEEKMHLARKEFQKVKSELSQISAQIDEKAEEEYRRLERRSSSLSSTISSSLKERDRLQKRIEEAVKLLQQYKSELNKLQTNTVPLEKLESEVNELNSKRSKLTSRLHEVKHELSLLKREKEHLENLLKRTGEEGTLSRLVKIKKDIPKNIIEKLENSLSGLAHLKTHGEKGEVITGPFENPKPNPVSDYVEIQTTEDKIKKFLAQFSVEEVLEGVIKIKGISFFPRDSEENPLKISRELEDTASKIEKLLSEEKKLQQELSILREKLEEKEQVYKQEKSKIELAQRKKDKLEREIFSIEKQINVFQNDLAELENSLKEMQEEKKSIDQSIKEFEKIIEKNKQIREKRRELYNYMNHLEKQISMMDKETAILDAKLSQFRSSIFSRRKEIETLQAEIEQSQKILEDLEHQKPSEEIYKLQNVLNIKKQERKNLEERISSLKDKLSSLRTKQELLKREKESIEEKINSEKERTSQILAELKEEFPDRLPEKIEKEEADTLKKLIKNWEKQLRNLGSVNLSASRIFKEINRRYTELKKEVEDLETSREKLLEIVESAQKEAKKAFLATLSEVSQSFNMFLKKLFEGGEGKIKVKGDILEGPIELNVKIPGKKIDSIQLFSGGERALVAIAFIFSLLKTKPVPFVIMDEVDAPLDEANIARFLSLVKDFSRGKYTQPIQFVIITHNKKTMSEAEVLYGVTMEEKGVSKVFSVELEGTGVTT